MSSQPISRTHVARRPPIFRVKTGCFTCRGRKKKCDEIKPVCSACMRNKLDCCWPTSAQTYRSAYLLKKHSPKPKTIIRTTSSPQNATLRTQPSPPVMNDIIDGPGTPTACPAISDSTSPETTSSMTSHSSDSSLAAIPSADSPIILHDPNDVNEEENIDLNEMGIDLLDVDEIVGPLVPTEVLSIPSQDGWDSIHTTISPFPCRDGRSLDLLSHYLSRTALSMGNGSTLINPFISQLIPLSFANSMILELVLCQSAAHRAMEDNTKLDLAHGYYNQSLRLFRRSIQNYVNGQDANPLWIVVGALIMCFTETAKGDGQGIIFDHIKGAGPLLSNLLNKSDALNRDLKDFIIEYYVYTASISLISVDPTSESTPFLSPELEFHGEKLVESGYVGQLCGSWLELLLLLPKIFRFGQRLRISEVNMALPTADDFVIFSTLQMQILSFQPLSLLGSDVALCGEIFKQAVHLYLLTSLTGAQEGGPFKQSVESAVDQSFEHLRQLPSTSRINTSLCWALGVIGSCVADEERRNELRSRLDVMFLMIGLGNIKATATLLEHIWALPAGEQSPWVISKAMRDNEIWISFA